MRKIWNVGIYARVSSASESQETSVAEQVAILKKWIEDRRKSDKNAKYNIIDIYEDNGFSGSNLNRDALKKMLDDIDLGKINMVLTKDLSRLSRNYLNAGNLIEEEFKIKDIRYVAAHDNVDTRDELDDFVAFRNVFNEMYIKDCSKKIKGSLKSRMERGSSIASKPPYGYRIEDVFEGEIKKKILVPANDETTEVIKEIYMLYIKGWGGGKIASYLNDKGIAPPSTRIENFGRTKFRLWNANTIISILDNAKYAGYMLQGQYKKVSYKSKKIKRVDKSEWIDGGSFEGIIDKDTFERVQEIRLLRKSRNYRYKGKNIHPFSTVLKCNGCGGSMSYRKKYEGYKCTSSQMGAKRCTPHSVKAQDLINMMKQSVQDDIKKTINKDKYYEQIDEIQIENSFEKELNNINKELDSLDVKFNQVYSDRLNGLINERNSNNILKDIQVKQEKLLQRKSELEKINSKNEYNCYYDIYKDEIDRLLNLDEIDRSLVEALIDRIEVTEIEGGKKKVDFYFKYARIS
ncbi:recombinase family protein [Clostridium sp. ETTB3]